MKSGNTPEIRKFIRKNSNLFWYIPDNKKEDISLEVLVEFILNYGSREAVKEMFEIVGIQKVAAIFYKQANKERSNYFLPVKNFFQLYFDRHV